MMEKAVLICDACGEGAATLAVDHCVVQSTRAGTHSIDLCDEHATQLYALCGLARPKRRYRRRKEQHPNGQAPDESHEE